LETGVYTGRDATESAHIDVISERFRLLYVAITRARRFLQISRSTTYQNFNKTMKSRPAEVVGVLYSYLKNG
ncbi:MAG: hypothetical protein KAG66_10240, partial [Methylococcales bacterium]|nr:hypothetical protein [Methylococcales bacterium]